MYEAFIYWLILFVILMAIEYCPTIGVILAFIACFVFIGLPALLMLVVYFGAKSRD